MKKALPLIDEYQFPNITNEGFRWLADIGTYVLDIKEVTANVDLPSLYSNITVVHATTVPGIKVGDYILLVQSTSFNEEFMIVNAKATADNEVSLRVHRGKSGTYNPPAEDFTFVYIKNNR